MNIVLTTILILYLAIGALVHTAVLGTTFVVTNMLSWGLIFAWPVFLFVILLLFAFIVVISVCCGMWIYESYENLAWVRARRLRKAIIYVRATYKPR